MRRVIRALLDSVVEGAIKRVAATGVAGEEFKNREYFQHYGFTSRPLAGAEGIVLREGNTVYLIASDDRRYRIALADGEVALYDDQGQGIKLGRNKKIEVFGCDQLTASVAVATEITCPVVRIVGALEVSGAISSATSVADPTGTMSAMRGIYNGHTHPGGGTPSTLM